jgi:hypothetical protein
MKKSGNLLMYLLIVVSGMDVFSANSTILSQSFIPSPPATIDYH